MARPPGRVAHRGRRLFIAGGAAALAAPLLATSLRSDATDALAALEAQSGGRLGVFMLDTASGRSTGHRADERFGMCSTFKLPLAALILREIDRGRLGDDQLVPYSQADMVPFAPVTSRHLGDGGMTVAALAEAAQVTSDNVAANLLLGLIGGPTGYTAKLRTAGDTITRLDRLEPAMNLVLPGELHDTTTPRAMTRLAAALLTERLLTPVSRDRLIGWMIATQSGKRRLRAGLPAGWRAGDKTGTAVGAEKMVDKYNDVAIAWPPGRAPILIACYLDAARSGADVDPAGEALHAEVGRIAARWAA